MTIAVHIAAHKFSKLGHLAQFILHLAKSNAGDHYIVFAEEMILNSFPAGDNITPVAVSPSLKNSLSIYYWYNFKLPSLVKRYNAEIFISNHNVLSAKTRIPQYLFIEQIKFLQPNKYVLKSFLKKNFPLFLHKAQTVFASERYIQIEVEKKYPTIKDKLQQLYVAAPSYFKPISWEKKEEILQQVSAGYDYFLFYLSPNSSHAFRTVLKAFSIFKKWQKSSMKLLLLQSEVDANTLINDLHLYKYRSDLVICNEGTQPLHANYIAAAYTVLYTPATFVGEELMSQAMQCEIPLICATNTEEHGFEKEILTVPLEENELAKQMIVLYKDEKVYKAQVQKTNALLPLFDFESNANVLRSAIGFKTGG